MEMLSNLTYKFLILAHQATNSSHVHTCMHTIINTVTELVYPKIKKMGHPSSDVCSVLCFTNSTKQTFYNIRKHYINVVWARALINLRVTTPMLCFYVGGAILSFT